MRRVAIIAVLLALPASTVAAQPPPRASVPTLTGVTLDIGDGAMVYIPASLAPGTPAPVLVLLHGAGGRPARILGTFRDEAERHRIILLAPASRAPTWDMIEEFRRHRFGTFEPSFAIDVPRIHAAIAALEGEAAVDRRRVAIGGFSDGASYALAVGTRDPRTFRSILAFSPGVAALPRRLSRSQHIFISHGRSDTVLDFDAIADGLVPQLRGKVALEFRPFTGGHVIPEAVQEEAVAFLPH